MIFNMVGGGGGSNIQLVSLGVSANGEYVPDEGQAYNNVTVNVQPQYLFNGGVLHTYRLAPNSTVNAGDFCYYGSITIDYQQFYAVFPLDYDRGGAGGSVTACVAKETKTAGAVGTTVNIDVYAPT